MSRNRRTSPQSHQFSASDTRQRLQLSEYHRRRNRWLPVHRWVLRPKRSIRGLEKSHARLIRLKRRRARRRAV